MIGGNRMSRSVDNNNREYLIAVGARLKGIRTSKGITQKQAAEDTGITQSFLSALESGKKSVCTAQIVSLIRYYNVTYEAVLGDYEGGSSLEDFSSCKNMEICSTLLSELVSDYSSLKTGTENCLKMCAYVLLRTIYNENPHNSQKIFSIDYETAMVAAEKVMKDAPENLSRFIRQSREINPRALEIPVQYSGELRAFIKECEGMLYRDQS